MYKFEIIVKDAGDLSDSGLFGVTIDDENDPCSYTPPLGDSPTAKRCENFCRNTAFAYQLERVPGMDRTLAQQYLHNG